VVDDGAFTVPVRDLLGPLEAMAWVAVDRVRRQQTVTEGGEVRIDAVALAFQQL
jgi:hypothetical protein